MELVYCFSGMVILCAIMGTISEITALISFYKNNLEQTYRYIGWFKSFIYCEFYFLTLEVAARFFA